MFLASFLLAALLASHAAMLATLAEGHLLLCQLEPPAFCDMVEAEDTGTIPADGAPAKTTSQLLAKMILVLNERLEEGKPHKRGERVDGRLRIMKQG